MPLMDYYDGELVHTDTEIRPHPSNACRISNANLRRLYRRCVGTC